MRQTKAMCLDHVSYVAPHSQVIATDHLYDSRVKSENLNGLTSTVVEFIYSSANDPDYGIIAVHLTKPSGVVRLDS